MSAYRISTAISGRIIQTMGAYPGTDDTHRIVCGITDGLFGVPPSTGSGAAYLAGYDIGQDEARLIEAKNA